MTFKKIADALPESLMALGAGGVSYGASLVYFPAGFVVGGLLLLAAGYVMARVK